MNRAGRGLSYIAILSALLVVSAAVWAAKPPPPPPPPPPPITFDLREIPGLLGQVNDANEAGDIVVYPATVYLAALEQAFEANDLLNDPNWSIDRAMAINNVGQIAVHAVYQGTATETLTPGVTSYYGLLNLSDGGSFSPMFERTAEVAWINDLNDSGHVCGTMPTTPSLARAFVMTPDDAAPRTIFPDEAGIIPSHAESINNAGQVVGWRAGQRGFRYSPASDFSPEEILLVGDIANDPAIGDSNRPRGINNSGEFAGYADARPTGKRTGVVRKVYRYTDGTGMVAVSGDLNSFCFDINDVGDVLWEQPNSTGYVPHLTLRQPTGDVKLSLKAAGVVFGSATDLARWQSDSQQDLHLDSSRRIIGSYSSVRQVFVLTPR